MDKPAPDSRATYRHFQAITTRWLDNDAYGHVNNTVYYSWFDTAVNQYLIEHGVLDVAHGAVIGLVVETQCNYFSAIAFPDLVHVGLRVTGSGSSSVRYDIAIFRNDEPLASAQGHFVHVYVDRGTRRPTALPAPLREVLAALRIGA